jgi:hypothetical protein
MTPDEFTAISKCLFGRKSDGYGWQAKMHCKTGCPLRTIQAWTRGTNPIPAIVASLLRLNCQLTKRIDNA